MFGDITVGNASTDITVIHYVHKSYSYILYTAQKLCKHCERNRKALRIVILQSICDAMFMKASSCINGLNKSHIHLIKEAIVCKHF